MTKRTIRLAESALADLEEIRSCYAEQGSPATGERFLRGIADSIGHLGDLPEMGRVVPEFGQKFLRELIRPPYRIVYRLDGESVRIVRLWRGERLLRLPDDDRL